MLNRHVLRSVCVVTAALAVTTGIAAAPLTAQAATGTAAGAQISARPGPAVRPGFTGGRTYRVYQRDNGSSVCLDASFQFSVCQYSPDPDDPPSLQKWVIAATGPHTYKLWNQKGTGWCLDLADFDAPCRQGDRSQQWSPVAAGGGAYYIEHQSSGGNTCLDESWTFKACSAGDAQQIWKLKLA